MENMIVLYDSKEQEFYTLGIGVLSDAISCIVTEGLNDSYELEMEYPINGSHYSDLQETRIILAKPNDFDDPQPFRIYKITRPIDGVVTVYAEHISYDMSKVPVGKFSAVNLIDMAWHKTPGEPIQVGKIKEAELIDSPFKFMVGPDKQEGTDITFMTQWPHNLRALLMGSDDSILSVYGGEFKYDGFTVTLYDRRGSDKDFTIRYSKNMIDLEQETSSELMYNGVCPYYNNSTTETKVGLGKKYTEIYISNETIDPLEDQEGNIIYPSKWLSYKNTGSNPIMDIIDLMVTNIIATEGDYYNHIVRAKRAIPKSIIALTDDQETPYSANWLYYLDDQGQKVVIVPAVRIIYKVANSSEAFDYYKWNTTGNRYVQFDGKDYDGEGSYFFDATYNTAYINKNDPYTHDPYWLCKDEDLVENYYPPENGAAYRVFTPGDDMYKVYIFDSSLGSNGEYRLLTSSDPYKEYPPTMPSIKNEQEEKTNVIVYEGNIIYVNEVRAIPIEGQREYSATWLQKIDEKLQFVSTDPRWVPVEHGEIVQTVGVPNSTIYKVPTLETIHTAYVISGSEMYSENWLTATPGGTVPIPEDQNLGYDLYSGCPFQVQREDETWYKCRWNAETKKYDHMVDTRYTYTNYEWDGNSYVVHNTSTDRIMTLDISDKFKETPNDTASFQKDLYDETITYIKETKMGTIKKSIKVSFLKLSTSEEYSKWKDLEKVALGDVVHVIYEDLGVSDQKKVIKTEYNVLTESYDSIEVGDKGTGFVDTAITEGDSVSALTNDRNFADITTVTKLVAERITAEFIQANQAEITAAQIQTLTADSITAQLITAQEFAIDKLIARLLVAEDAAIRNTLTVGTELIVSGEINIKNGTISINGENREADTVLAYINENPESGEAYKYDYLVTTDGGSELVVPARGVVYRALDETGIMQYFKYQFPDGENEGRYIPQYYDADVRFEVDESGNVKANSLEITGGYIMINEKIVVSYIDSEATAYDYDWLYTKEGETDVAIYPEEWTIYRVYDEQDSTSYLDYRWDESRQKYYQSDIDPTAFEVDNHGYLKANNAEIVGKIVATSGDIGGCLIEDGHLIVDTAHIAGTLSADDIEGGTISASSIALGFIKQPTKAYITHSEVTQYGSSWLISPDTKATISPQTDALYQVYSYTEKEDPDNPGTYILDTETLIGYYEWIIDTETPSNTAYKQNLHPFIFEVNEQGDVISHSLQVLDGEIKISSGSKFFELNHTGELNANYVHLTGGTAESLSISELTITGNLYFDGFGAVDAYVKEVEGQYTHKFNIANTTSSPSSTVSNITLYLNTNESLVGKTVAQVFEIVTSSPVYEGTADVAMSDGYSNNHVPVQIRKENNRYHLYVENIGDVVNTSYSSSHNSLDLTDISSLDKDNLLNYSFNSTTKELTITHINTSQESSRVDYDMSSFSSNGTMAITTIAGHFKAVGYDITSFIVTSDIIDDESIYGPNWLVDEDGNGIIPDASKVYHVTGNDGFLGFFKYYTSDYEYKKMDDEGIYRISNSGIYLPGIKSDADGTVLAGFTATESSLVSIDANTGFEVGMSHDSTEDYTFWSGVPNAYGVYQFSVSRAGNVNATKFGTGNIFINNTYITTNEDKRGPSGQYLDEDGIFINKDSWFVLTKDGESIRMGDSVDNRISIVTPKLLVNSDNVSLTDRHIGTMPFLSINTSVTGPSSSYAYSVTDEGYNDTDYLYLFNINLTGLPTGGGYTATVNMPNGYVALYAYGSLCSASVNSGGLSIRISSAGSTSDLLVIAKKDD